MFKFHISIFYFGIGWPDLPRPKDLELLRIWDTTTIKKKDIQENRMEHRSEIALDGRQTHAVMYLATANIRISSTF